MTAATRQDIRLSGALKVSFLHVCLCAILFVISMHIGLTSFLYKLDERSKKKLGSNAARVIKRVYGTVRESASPRGLPAWMVADDPGTELSPTTSAAITTPPQSSAGPSRQRSAIQSTPRSRPLSELNLDSDSFWSTSNSSMYVFDECVTEV